MRPIRRGASPIEGDFENYKDAKPFLVSRLGLYCSYCERQVPSMLAVEHIQPKQINLYPHLEGCWDNFLLACTNCNSIKGHKDLHLDSTLLPDRDNTAHAYTYLADGSVNVADGLQANVGEMAEATLRLTGLQRSSRGFVDENEEMVALDRVCQRMEAWATAEECRTSIHGVHSPELLRQMTVRLALATGFFSVWMTVFEDDAEMRTQLVEAFNGTNGSGCFDPETAATITPCPNLDALEAGGKS